MWEMFKLLIAFKKLSQKPWLQAKKQNVSHALFCIYLEDAAGLSADSYFTSHKTSKILVSRDWEAR